MQRNLLSQIISLIIVVVFIGSGIHPALGVDTKSSFNSSTLGSDIESVNDELVEISVSFYKSNEMEKHKVMLTLDQVNKLDNIINDIKNDLENSKNIEDTISIFDQAIISFHNLGLLPNHISINEIQKLIKNNYDNVCSYEKKSGLNENLDNDSITNENCYISGELDTTFIFSPAIIGLHNMMLKVWEVGEMISEIFPWLINEQIIMMWVMVFSLVIYKLMNAQLKRRLAIGSEICVGITDFSDTSPVPSFGWISTDGLYGKKNISGYLYGYISELTLFIITTIIRFYSGVVGFNGLKIERETNETYFIGCARKVHIGTEPPIARSGVHPINLDIIDKYKIFNLNSLNNHLLNN